MLLQPDGAPCPNTTSTCQELSFYTNQASAYFTSNTVFYFLEGHHILDHQDTFTISHVSNLKLLGLGTIEPGPHETVMQSTVVIECNRGFAFIETQFVTIEAITLNGCTGNSYNFGNFGLEFFDFGIGPSANAGLGLICSHIFYLRNASVQNSSGYGVLVVNSFNLTIEGSSFYRNQYPTVIINCNSVVCQGGIVFSDYCLDESSTSTLANNSTLKIVKSNFSLSFGQQILIGSGLMIAIANIIKLM